MSGGAFEYKNHFIEDIASQIELGLNKGGDEYSSKVYEGYPEAVLDRFRLAVKVLRMAGKMAYEIDYLLSCDTGPESFLNRWKDEGLDDEPLHVKKLRNNLEIAKRALEYFQREHGHQSDAWASGGENDHSKYHKKLSKRADKTLRDIA